MSETAQQTSQNETPLNFTDAAAHKVKSLIIEEENPKLNLRVFITGGGCSGFQYGFTFDETINDDDIVVEKEASDEDGGEGGETGGTVKLLIDPLSFQYLKGADIDYREDLNGSQFIIRNPNAKTTCGCGSSIIRLLTLCAAASVKFNGVSFCEVCCAVSDIMIILIFYKRAKLSIVSVPLSMEGPFEKALVVR